MCKLFLLVNPTTSGTTIVEHPERPTTEDDIFNTETTTQIPSGETGKSRNPFLHSPQRKFLTSLKDSHSLEIPVYPIEDNYKHYANPFLCTPKTWVTTHQLTGVPSRMCSRCFVFGNLKFLNLS